MSGASPGARPIWIGGLVVAGAVIAGGLWFAASRNVTEPTATPGVSVDEVQPEQTLTVTLPEPLPEPLPRPAPARLQEQAAVVQTEPVPVAEDQADTGAPEPVQSAAAPNSLPNPRLDAFRMEPDGLAVIAGRAIPGDTVLLRIDGAEIARTDAGADGAFAAVAFITPSNAPRVLTLVALGADGIERASPDEFIIAPMAQTVAAQGLAEETVPASTPDTAPDAAPDRAAETTRAVDPNAATNTASKLADSEPTQVAVAPVSTDPVPAPFTHSGDTANQPDANQADASQTQDTGTLINAETPSSPVAQAAPQADPSGISAVSVAPNPSVPVTNLPSETSPVPNPTPSANQVAILRSTPQGVDVIQPPGPPPETLTRVALDAISYSAEGDVQLSGRAERRASEVRVYLDNSPIATLKVDTTGAWRGDVQGVASGVYTLRLDAVDAEGDVQSRLETPFKREAPELLAAAAASSSEAVRAITVQQGATLWAIARERYGDPLLYVQVFEANRAQIRDPDLIYPGQVFTLPEDTE